ncbi:hypothetical protein BDZ91DRAFT_208385 [Kalaharituber pfeilii]|nr:hypothetical protein BDZ91DRAFT_208385 [Kalaharituber pfeilii]
MRVPKPQATQAKTRLNLLQHFPTALTRRHCDCARTVRLLKLSKLSCLAVSPIWWTEFVHPVLASGRVHNNHNIHLSAEESNRVHNNEVLCWWPKQGSRLAQDPILSVPEGLMIPLSTWSTPRHETSLSTSGVPPTRLSADHETATDQEQSCS